MYYNEKSINTEHIEVLCILINFQLCHKKQRVQDQQSNLQFYTISVLVVSCRLWYKTQLPKFLTSKQV